MCIRDRYKIIKVIGDGTYGVVSKAVNIKTNEIVAIKRMKKKFPSWDECMQLREIKSLRKLNHPNVIKLKEVIRVNDTLHLIFEFAENDLFQLMESRGGAFSEAQIRGVVQQILLGVSYIHRNGFFHRDLKPENLMTNKSPAGLLIKICDFGQAREIRSTPPYTEYISTRWYRAPECLLRSNVYSSPVDMFAVGCMMAELYLGRPLFQGSSEGDQLFKICSVLGTPTAGTWAEGLRLGAKAGYQFPHFVPTPLASLIPSASKDGIDLMTSMLQFDPQRRVTAVKALAHPYFASLPVKDLATSHKVPKRCPEFSAVVTEHQFRRMEQRNEDNGEERDSDSNRSFTKYSLNDSIDSANHSKGFHKSGTSSKGSKSHSRLPQVEVDDISDILDEHLGEPLEKERARGRRNKEEDKSAGRDNLIWEDDPIDTKGLDIPVALKEVVQPKRVFKRNPMSIQIPLAIPAGSANKLEALSDESNFSYHKKHLGAATNPNAEIAKSGLSAAIRKTYNKDLPLFNIYGGDVGVSGRKAEENAVQTGYGQAGTMSYGSIGVNQTGLTMGKMQFNYGRYKYQK
eukprot:TRINITY_DN2961_c0_g1_i3.p1 TRINITY_DN2961_c0_g1~~TRINITY_DN2961_c0_g1_i3.p1  ORF type:complete len:571 (+),score=174.79 TRINITY_DN2961_c0_g1_i3:76-1788(+)